MKKVKKRLPFAIKEIIPCSNSTTYELVYWIILFVLPQFEQGIYRTLSFSQAFFRKKREYSLKNEAFDGIL